MQNFGVTSKEHYGMLKWPQEKLKAMLMQNFGVTSKEHYGMLWYFLEWSIEEALGLASLRKFCKF